MSTLDFEKSENGKSEGSRQEVLSLGLKTQQVSSDGDGFPDSLEACTGELDDSVDSLMGMAEESGASSMEYEGGEHKESSADSDLRSSDADESSDLNDMAGFVSEAHMGITVDPLKNIADVDAAMESESEEEEKGGNDKEEDDVGGGSTDDANQDSSAMMDEGNNQDISAMMDEGNVSSEKEEVSKDDEGSKDLGKEEEGEKDTSEEVTDGERLQEEEIDENVLKEDVSKEVVIEGEGSAMQKGEDINTKDRSESEETLDKDDVIMEETDGDGGTSIGKEAMGEDVIVGDKSQDEEEDESSTKEEKDENEKQASSEEDKEKCNDKTSLSQDSTNTEAKSNKFNVVTCGNVNGDLLKKKPGEGARILLLSTTGQPIKLKTKSEEEPARPVAKTSGPIVITTQTRTEKGKEEQKGTAAGSKETQDGVPVLGKKVVPTNIKDIKIGKISTSTNPVKGPSQFVVIPYSKDGTAKLMTQTVKSPPTQQDKDGGDAMGSLPVTPSSSEKTKKAVPMVTLSPSSSSAVRKMDARGKDTDTKSKDGSQEVPVKCVRVSTGSPKPKQTKTTATTAPQKMISNVIQIKRKLQEIMEHSRTEEEEASKELQRMKRQKMEILTKITAELDKLKHSLHTENVKK